MDFNSDKPNPAKQTMLGFFFWFFFGGGGCFVFAPGRQNKNTRVRKKNVIYSV